METAFENKPLDHHACIHLSSMHSVILSFVDGDKDESYCQLCNSKVGKIINDILFLFQSLSCPNFMYSIVIILILNLLIMECDTVIYSHVPKNSHATINILVSKCPITYLVVVLETQFNYYQQKNGNCLYNKDQLCYCMCMRYFESSKIIIAQRLLGR